MSDETKRKKSARKKPSSKKAIEVAKNVDESALSETLKDDTTIPARVKKRVPDERITCCVCGHSTPKKLAFIVNGDKYVCSKRCLSRFATARPRF